jgi:plasmid stability protein
MATLTIRNLPEDVRDKLRVRAAEHGRSMEAEARDLLSRAVGVARVEFSLEEKRARVRAVQDAFRKYRQPGESVVDEFLAERLRLWGEE